MQHGSVLERVRDLTRWLAKQTPAIEAERRIGADVIAALTGAGCLRMAVPAEHGGTDLALPALVEVVEELARADGSVGWLMGQVALAHVVFGYLPPAVAAEIYAAGPDVYAAGAAAPKGRATHAGGRWRISGRWPLVSGCRDAAWLYLQCLVSDEVDAGSEPGAIPAMRTVVVPASDARLLETYRGLGLRGSASHDVVVRALDFPEGRTCDLTAAPATAAELARIPVATQAGLVAAAVMLGTAAGALDAVLELAARKRPSFSAQRLADSPLFQDRAGEAAVTLAAARWLLRCEIEAADEGARRAPLDAAGDAHLRAVGAQAAALALSVVDAAYTLGGSSSVSEGSPLERRLRDARSLSQHAALSSSSFTRVGALAAGAR